MRLLVSAVGVLPEQVTLTGFVADPGPLWQQSRVFVAPQVEPAGLVPAILEAWLRGVPVVATRAAGEGLTMRPGQTNLLADEPEAFAQAVLSLLSDNQMAEGISRNARHWVGQHYDWRSLYADLEPEYARLARG
jgi:glycosyltransferase involved in cell wall biosynthesis